MTRSAGDANDRIPKDIVEVIRSLRAPIMISHVVPDADALGSMFALARAMQSDRCRANVSLPDGSLSKRISFMLDWAEVGVASGDDFSRADGFVALDTAKKPRCNVERTMKASDWVAGRPLVNIDHHATNTLFGTVNWIASEASSTCEMIGRLLLDQRLDVDEMTASLLYAGIQTDTLGFSLPSTSSDTLAVAAELASRGARVGALGERLDRSLTQSEFDLLRIVYANTKCLAGGRLAYSSAGYEEIHGAGCTAADIDDQISVPRSLTGVVLAMLFTEGQKGRTRINFRGSGGVSVVELAAVYGGGGHTQAAGAILDCPLDEAIARVLPEAESHLKKFL